MTIYDQLKSDHRKVLHLLDELISVGKSNTKKRDALIQEIADDLIPHSRAEEAVLYNSMRDIETAGGVVAHSYQEHLEAETLLRSLQVTDAMNIHWLEGAKKLRAALKHHIAEEEGKVFAAAKMLFTSEEAEAMARAFNQIKPLVKKQSFVGQSLDMVGNLMPTRLRDSFVKFAGLPMAS